MSEQESIGVNSSVYVFTRIRELYLKDNKLYTTYTQKWNTRNIQTEV